MIENITNHLQGFDFDEENLIFKTKKGTPLDTKRKHKEYMEEINLNK